MNIGMTHFRVGETDGVSLEMDKWKRILENNGHKVFYIAGSSAACEALIIPQLSYRDKQDAEISAECFESNPKLSEISVKEKISKLSKEIEN
ncbi:MAG: hypothetical protein KAQ68_03130 [Clostridiales bacterium]|nr:hypothetical protein [Clostridiales bacterium]